MEIKILEIRDEGTFIPVLAIDMNLDWRQGKYTHEIQRYYLHDRCGYSCDGTPNILLTNLNGNSHATNDPYGWKDGARTFPVAHNWIIEHWNELRDGDVIDVSFILGETKESKISERLFASEGEV